jgi:hypothetical protein
MADVASRKPREATLLTEIPPCASAFLPTGVWGVTGGWGPIGTSYIGYDTTIDLSGYNIRDETFFTLASSIQDPGRYTATMIVVDYSIEVLEVVSQIPLSLTQISLDWDNGSLPGFSGSKQTFTNIIIGQYRDFAKHTNYSAANNLIPIKGVSFGSTEPTASDKLYVYVLVKINTPGAAPSPGDAVGIPERRIVIGGVSASEPDLEYLMRMRRSYELDT